MKKEQSFTEFSERFQQELFGNFDRNIKRIEEFYQIDIVLRSGEIVLIGEEEKLTSAVKLIEELHRLVQNGESLDTQKINYAIGSIEDNLDEKLSDVCTERILLSAKGNIIKPKTVGQKKYVDNIDKHDITLCVGPAGTGKTYLAVAMAVRAFKREEVSRIILTRPAVEAGESLGFLPGDLKDKVDPYLRPLYDALFDIMGSEKFLKLLERGVIEVAPLAYMRGRTLDNSFIILDEAQNTTREQMKMFLTRLGFGSKAVVTGDITQVDLPGGKVSGLMHSLKILEGVRGIALNYLDEKDVVRHELVQRIIKAYEKFEAKEKYKKEQKKGGSRSTR